MFFSFGFSIIRIFVFVIFVIVIAAVLTNLFRGAGQWNRNNHQPVLNVIATVVAKREEVTFHHHMNSTMSNSRSTYFITFEVESGDRMEFSVTGREYGMLVEQDFGTLTFQGSRYLGFERS